MSLVGTLGKIAMGVVAAKAAGSMMRGGGSVGGLGGMLGGALGGGQGQQQGGGGLGGMLGGALGGGQGQQQGGGGLGGLLGGALGGGGAGAGGLAGGLGSLLGGGAQQPEQQGGGLGGLLGGQSQQGGAGGLGGLLDSLGGGAGQAGAGGSLGGMLNAQLTGQQAAEPEPEPAQEEEAKILIRAMLNSAKCDGNFHASEQEKILKQMGDISQEDADFINTEINTPLDVQGFISSVPGPMQQQVYLMSILAIDLDSQEEAQYLDQLVKGFGMSEQQSNEIHAKLGVPALYG